MTPIAARLLLCAVTLNYLPGLVRAEWRPTGPFGGAAEIIRFVPAAPGSAIAGTRNGLLYRSQDNGNSWSLIPFAGQMNGTLHALEVDPRSADVWYVGLEGNDGWRSGLYKTTDAGRTWKMAPGLKGHAIWSIAIFPGDADTLAAGANDGVFLSKDAGETWQRISAESNQDIRPVVSLAFHPANSQILYAGTTHLAWRTADGGTTWQSIHNGMLDDSDVFSIQVDRSQPDIVLASACSGSYRSTTAGSSWTRLPTPHGAFRTYFIALDPSPARQIFAGTTTGLFRSTDTGKTWARVTTDVVKSLAFDPAHPSNILFASLSGGILTSGDGGATLHPSNQGFSNRNFAVMAGSGDVFYVTSLYEPGSGGLFRSNDSGSTWSRMLPEHDAENILMMAVQPENPNQVFAVERAACYRSKDGGKSWERQPAPPGSAPTALVTLEDGSILTGTSAGIFRKGANGRWTPVPAAPNVRSVQLLQAFGKSSVAAVADSKAYVSTDAGSSWKKCGDLPVAPAWYGISLNSDGIALAATSDGLFRSADSCASWTPVRSGVDAGTVSTVVFHPLRPEEAYISQYGKVLQSIDRGEHWQAFDDAGRDGLYPSRLFISSAMPNRLLGLFPRRGILINTINSDGNMAAGSPSNPAGTTKASQGEMIHVQVQ